MHGKGCDDPGSAGSPARTRLGRVVAIGFTGLVGSPADWRRGSAFTRMRAGRPRSQGETHGWPSADPNFAKGSGDIDRQDRQDKQDEKPLHRKLTGSMIGCACEVIHKLGSGFLESCIRRRR